MDTERLDDIINRFYKYMDEDTDKKDIIFRWRSLRSEVVLAMYDCGKNEKLMDIRKSEIEMERELIKYVVNEYLTK